MIDVKAQREAVADSIRAVVPGRWTVYAAPPSIESVPAIIVGPASAYLERMTFTEWQVHLRLTILQPLAAGAATLDILDEALADLLPQLDTVTTFRVDRVESAGELVTRSGVEVIGATLELEVV